MKSIILFILSTFTFGTCYHYPDDCIRQITLVNHSDQEVYVAYRLHCASNMNLQTLYRLTILKSQESFILESAFGKCLNDENSASFDGWLFFVPPEYYPKPGEESCFPRDSLIARYRVLKAVKLTKAMLDSTGCVITYP